MNNPFKLKVVLVTHSRLYSAPQALRDYLREKKYSLCYISNPLPLKNSDPGDSYVETGVGNKIFKKNSIRRGSMNILFSSIYDSFLTFFWAIKNGRTDIFIGVDNLNAVVGVILKKLGLVRYVVYYTIDYFPTRFENKRLNDIYHWIDKICLANADETWNVSKNMEEARQKHRNLSRKKYRNQYTVPIGIWYDNAPRKPFEKINKKKIIFVGHLLDHMGVDLVIRAMPLVIKKIPDIKFEIIGGGEEEKKLKELSRKMKLSKYIKFWGWIDDRAKLEKIMSDGAIGIATFNTDILDDKVKNADPGKIKDYMLLGMPVILTDAASSAYEINKKKCGILVKYEIEDLANAIIRLLKNRNLLKTYRRNALEYIAQFDYNKIFNKNISRIIKNNLWK